MNNKHRINLYQQKNSATQSMTHAVKNNENAESSEELIAFLHAMEEENLTESEEESLSGIIIW